MAIVVDWPSRVIDIPQVDLTATADPNIFILQLDPFFKNELRLLEASEEGIVFPTIVNYVPPINIGSVALASVVEIINNYTATFEDGQYAVNFEGANTNLQDQVNVNQVSVRPNNSAGLTYSKQVEDTAFTDARVWIDTQAGLPGVTYPQGTPSTPVNNLADALTIIQQRNLGRRLHITGQLDIDVDLVQYDIIGPSPALSEIGLTGTDVSGSRFSRVSITGDFVGGNGECSLAQGVATSDITRFSGEMSNIAMSGTVQFDTPPGIDPPTWAVINCYSVVEKDSFPIYDFGLLTNGIVNLRKYVGGVELRNLTDPDVEVILDMDPGAVRIHPSCTDGRIVIRGVALVVDNTTSFVGELDTSGVTLLEGSSVGGANVVSVNGVPVSSVEDFKADIAPLL